MRKLALLVLCISMAFSQVIAQSRTISGKVMDESGNPLLGATISAVGGGGNATTNATGAFTINVPPSARQLEISYVGFGTQTISIGNQTTVTIRMASSASLENVVVTGYSRVKKAEYTGAATKVEAEKINFVPMASFDQILQGKSPGLLVTAGSGQPGAAARVQIRGDASISGGNSPLYVLDGMVIEGAVFQSLNPNDFESVDVLRDAVATAQYGNRGSSGVIVITTKKGKSGKATVSYNGQLGLTEAGTQKFDMMNSTEILKFQENLGLMVPNSLPGFAFSRKNPANVGLPAATLAGYDRMLDSMRAINTNWKDIFLRNGTFQSHDINVSGGNGGTTYYLGGGYYKEEGIGLRSDLERYSFRANVNTKTDKLTVSFNSGAGYTKRNFIESENGIALANPFAAAYLALPYDPLFLANGDIATGGGKTGANAYSRVFDTDQNNGQIKITGSMNLNYDIFKHVYVGGFAGIDYRQTVNERSVYPNTWASNNTGFPTGPGGGSTTGGGSYATGYNNFSEVIMRAFTGYRNVFKEIHDVDVKFITEFTKDNIRAFNYTGYGINPKLLNTPAGITPGNLANNLIPGVTGSKGERALQANMLLANYTYKGKYTFNGSVRRDASSQLPVDTRYATFYAVGGIWNVLKENFTQNWRLVNELRLRATYGTSANSDGFPQGYYGHIPTYGGGTFNGQQTIVPATAGNNSLVWETSATLNLGLDFALLKNRLHGAVDVYNKKATDVILSQKLAAAGGFRNLFVNTAAVLNKGIEMILSYDIVRNRDLVWTINGNAAYNHNEVTSLGQVGEVEQGTELVKVGLPLGTHYVVEWAGVDAATGAPLYYTKDGKLTNLFSNSNQNSKFGTYNAPWKGGFGSRVSYKGFTVEALFTFQEGFSRFNNQDFFQLNHAFAVQGFNLRQEMLTMWQKPGDVTNIQSPVFQRNFSSKDVQDASYTRFRNLTVSYDVPKSLIAKQKYISSIRIYGQAQNLFTWTNWVGFDPEDNNNIAGYEYPTPRIYTMGLNVSFK